MSSPGEQVDFQTLGQEVIHLEARALMELSQRLGAPFADACRMILGCEGRVIVTGMGKSGHIASKITASLASTGTAAQFLHPAEAVHGDLGVITSRDLLIALSYSGETQEILDLISALDSRAVRVIAVTSTASSSLGRLADVTLELGKVHEADPFDLVPTTSTLLTLAIGDALVIALMHARGFTEADFAVFHPKGALGRRLTLAVRDLLHGDKTNPVLSWNSVFGSALEVISRYALGGTSIVDEDGRLHGLLTDGDVRRVLETLADRGGTISEAMQIPVAEIMTRRPLSVSDATLAYEALGLMENHKPRPIFVLPVVDNDNRPVGLLHLHALVQAGFEPGSST